MKVVKMACEEVKKKCFSYEILAKCSTSKARAGVLQLPHHSVQTPVFMPVSYYKIYVKMS